MRWLAGDDGERLLQVVGEMPHLQDAQLQAQ
jgi:hypothetical protein